MTSGQDQTQSQAAAQSLEFQNESNPPVAPWPRWFWRPIERKLDQWGRRLADPRPMWWERILGLFE